MLKDDIITQDRARCGGAEIYKRQTNDKPKYKRERKAAPQREETGWRE